MLSVFCHLTVLIIFFSVLSHVFLTVLPKAYFLVHQIIIFSQLDLLSKPLSNLPAFLLSSATLPHSHAPSHPLYLSGVCASDSFKLQLMMNETHPWGTDLGSSVGWCSATHWTCGPDSLFMACTNSTPTSQYLYLWRTVTFITQWFQSFSTSPFFLPFSQLLLSQSSSFLYLHGAPPWIRCFTQFISEWLFSEQPHLKSGTHSPLTSW